MLQRIAHLLRIQPAVVDNRGLLWGSGDTVPGAVDGWQTGAIFQHTDGTDGTALYVNEGTITSCDFVAVDTAPGEDAGQIIFATTATAPLIDINGSYDDQFIESGTYASTADNGIVVSATNNRPVSFLFDDGGDLFTAGDIRAGLFRLLLTIDQTNAVTLNALRAQIKANNLVDITSPNSVTSPFTGYLELDGAGVRHLDGHVACVRAALETGAGAHTVDLNLCGFEATLNSSGTFVGDGYSAAFAANISGGTSKWQYGLYIDGNAVTTGISMAGCTKAFEAVVACATTKYGASIVSTITDGKSDGIAAYFEGHVAGTPTGQCFAVGAWLNVDAAPSGANTLRALDVGVWTDQDLSDVSVYGMNIGLHLGSGGAPTNAYQMRFNHSGHALDAWFHASNAGAIGFAAGADEGATKVGDIPIAITGYGTVYIKVYDGTS